MTKIFLRAATFTLYMFAFMRITDNFQLLKYLYAPDDKPIAAKSTAKNVPLTTKIAPKKP